MPFTKPVVGFNNINSVVDNHKDDDSDVYVYNEENPEVHGSTGGFGVRQRIGTRGGVFVESFEVLDAVPAWYIREQTAKDDDDNTKTIDIFSAVLNHGGETVRISNRGTLRDGIITGVTFLAGTNIIPFSGIDNFRPSNVATDLTMRRGWNLLQGEHVHTIHRIYDDGGTLTVDILITSGPNERLATGQNINVNIGARLDNLSNAEINDGPIRNANPTTEPGTRKIRPV